jgi:LCP family protein required for cell wall assembly
LIAAALSALVPGSGQILGGRRKRGVVLLVIDMMLLGLIYVFFDFGDKITIAQAFVRPSTMTWMMLANIVILAYRAWAAYDAFVLVSGPRVGTLSPTSRRVATVLGVAVAAIGFVVLTPHVVFGYYDLTQYNLITGVFAADSEPTTTTSAAPTVAAPAGGTTASGDPTGTTTLNTTTTTQSPENIFEDLDRLNILLIGADASKIRTGLRTDTMITVSIDPETGDAAMFSVPRNWTYAPLPEGMGVWDCDCYPELINELWTQGERKPEAFPGPGSPPENAVKGVISEFLGIPIHYYAMVNLDGFVDVIDALGGIEMYVPTRVVDSEYPDENGGTVEIVFEPGRQEMDGHLALAYARTRRQDSDYFRMNRQRCVIDAVLEQTDPLSLLANFGSIADAVKRSMQTDIPISALPQLVELLPKVDRENIVSVRFIPPDYHLKYRDDGGAGRIANIELVHEHVDLVIADPEAAVVQLGLNQLENVCGEAEPAPAITESTTSTTTTG